MAKTTDKIAVPSHRGAPGSWSPARRLVLHALGPVGRFLETEASSGVLLLAAAAIALLWANSPWQESYSALWHTRLGVRLGSFTFGGDLRFWVNDGVMTFFFFVIGLELRREIHRGVLSEWRRAALPLAAAMGGMLLPACIFATVNFGRKSIGGWGIPMATDIAFAVGVLSLLGKRVPPALRILLLALAVIDDVGAILVIALFYSSSLSMMGFLVLGAGIGAILAMQRLNVRSPWAYVPPAVCAWAGAYVGGLHPTLVGVAVGLLTPGRASFGRDVFIEHAEATLAAVRGHVGDDERALLAHLDPLNKARREVISPVERLQYSLHGWVAFGAMPLFALANAGVVFGHASFSGDSLLVFLGIVGGLVLGKPLGILAFSWLTTRLGLAALPGGITWPQLVVVGVVGGIGFTMSIFIAALAFPTGSNVETAKIAILLGSAIAAILAYAFGRMILQPTGTSIRCLETGSQDEDSCAR